MTFTAADIRRMPFDAIEADVLTEEDRWVLNHALERRSICGEDTYFWEPRCADAFRRLCHYGFFYLRKGADPARPLAPWRLTRMGAAMAHRIKDAQQAAPEAA